MAKSTMGSKARQVRDLLRISPFSPEFKRADVARRNPLFWIIEVNGLAMDARHLPMDIQMQACRRGLISYVPALGPDGKAPREESPVGRTTSAAVPAMVGLLERSRELKRQLVDFARSPRFSRQLEIFAAEHPELTETDRQMLLGWREVMEGVFEIRQQLGDTIVAVNLVDELAYRIRTNAGSGALASLRPGLFMTARIVPLGGDWMLSGVQTLFHATERAAMLRLAAERTPRS